MQHTGNTGNEVVVSLSQSQTNMLQGKATYFNDTNRTESFVPINNDQSVAWCNCVLLDVQKYE